MNTKSLKEIKLLRCNSGADKIKNILIETDNCINDINENRRKLLNISNNIDKITNINDSNNNNNNNNNDNNENNDNDNDNVINKENNNIKTIPFTFSIQYKNINEMEKVIWSTANTLIKKNKVNDDDNNNDKIDLLKELPDLSNDVELNQINKINELISWRQELMKNCISSP